MTPLLVLNEVTRSFPAGEEEVIALKSVSLTIERGEMIAIMGASGSGKSTLMNILGCLDQPTRGTYRIAGKDVKSLSNDALAQLRREHFGFIFQRYHLLSDLSALNNVELPAAYTGMARTERQERAAGLLQQLGLHTRIHYRPNQLSGGQQQRVSIARALMNGGEVILADEPTGALDSKSGAEVLQILHDLHKKGHTIIIVTHDPAVAQHAQRIIELKDGEIIRDAPNRLHHAVSAAAQNRVVQNKKRASWGGFREAFKMAWRAMLSHRLRTALTMLGIIIGIMSVVSISAIGEGAKRHVLDDLRSIVGNLVEIYPGADWGDDRAKGIRTLLPGDVTALQAEPYIDSVTPESAKNVRLRYKNVDVNVMAVGVNEQFFRVERIKLAMGVPFQRQDITRQSQVAVIDQNVRRKLFGEYHNPLGEVILVGSTPVRVIGVTKKRSSMFTNSQSIYIFLPYTIFSSHISGQLHFDGIMVRFAEGQPGRLVEQNIARLLSLRHGSKDFFTHNLDDVANTMENISRSLSLFLSVVALISLVVGGIGVMNIMLVSVTERTREIGIRMAVGARQRDIMQQFLTEAVLVCLIGGVIGVVLSYAASLVFDLFVTQWQMVFSAGAIVSAFLCATFIGIVFGYLPARNAARLDPVEALARE